MTTLSDRSRAAAAALWLCAGFLGLSCAGQVAPSGGAPDTTPPEIVATDPAPGTLGFRGTEVRVELSEYVDRRSLEESVFLSPPLGRLEFDWSGTEVSIRFRDTLRANTTYILTVGTDVHDVREKRNRMSASFALPFSTGDHIDSAAISGRIFDADPAGIMIFAYSLTAREADSVNPGKLKPDFVTQTGQDGSFVLPYLPPDAYRLFAVGDEYKNLLYDRQIDRFGAAAGDVLLTPESSKRAGVQFRLSREDTSAPFLSSVKAIDREHLLARFSEPMDTTGVTPAAFAVADTLSGEALAVFDVSFSDSTRLEAQLVTGAQDSSRTYRVTVSSLRDLARNPIGAGSSVGVVTGSPLPDTLRPQMTPPFSSDSVRNVPPDRVFSFAWKEAVRRPSFEGGFLLVDSAGAPVPGAFRWNGAMNAAFRPAAALALNGWHAMRIAMDSVADLSGNRGRDSVLVFHFQVGDERQMSSLAGSVKDPEGGRSGPIHVLAANVAPGRGERYEAVLDSAGVFGFPKVTEGRYVFELFRDSDGNAAYSPGATFPFRAAEEFALHPDTVKARARWPVEGIVLKFPEEP